MRYRVGVDVGGTFTDFLIIDDTGNPEVVKTSTTPADPSLGFFRGIERAAARRGMDVEAFLARVDVIVHGTTITTNATLTGDGAVAGFITTRGFRDLLGLRRGLKDRQFEKYPQPAPLVPRERVHGVEERVNYAGEVLTPLNEAEVVAALDALAAQQVEAIAVSLLWSFQNPAHEQRIGQLVRERLPAAYLSLSTEVLPQIRVYERHSTTALNAYVGPVLTRYLSRLQSALDQRGFRGNLLIMQSNGGVMTPEVARRFAVNTLLSGPAGAPMAGIHYGATHGFRNVITVDMGGTSFDVALIRDAQPGITTEGEIGGHRVASPILDIHTVGAGGGSIASLDGGGVLRVGPRSAGAMPGPALYGRGGTLPTVTDAQFALGYLDPARFEAGELSADPAAATEAIRTHVATPLQLDVTHAADAIYQVVNHHMAAAIEVVSVQRGYDPREFVLVVAGGAGPLHGAALARELDIPLLMIPRESSVFCAVGMLISDLKHDYVRTYARDLSGLEASDLGVVAHRMATEAEATLASEQVDPASIVLDFSVDVRYVGQFNEVEVAVGDLRAGSAQLMNEIAARFHARHDALYGYAMRGAPLELINVRLTARGLTPKPKQAQLPLDSPDSAHAAQGTREAFFDGTVHHVPVFEGTALRPGNQVTGPAIVVQPATTIVVPPDFALWCDEYANYLMYRQGDDLQALRARLAQ
ncbi:MAG: hydantoinase/oxoprolinase family protein [Gammaproteobacteria bacterium]